MFRLVHLNKEKRAKIAELRKTDPKAASELQRAISYHIDHGYGMDCYAVGPTPVSYTHLAKEHTLFICHLIFYLIRINHEKDICPQ